MGEVTYSLLLQNFFHVSETYFLKLNNIIQLNKNNTLTQPIKYSIKIKKKEFLNIKKHIFISLIKKNNTDIIKEIYI